MSETRNVMRLNQYIANAVAPTNFCEQCIFKLIDNSSNICAACDAELNEGDGDVSVRFCEHCHREVFCEADEFPKSPSSTHSASDTDDCALCDNKISDRDEQCLEAMSNTDLCELCAIQLPLREEMFSDYKLYDTKDDYPVIARSKWNETGEVEGDFAREDVLPHLPTLAETARSGCRFCQMLIEAMSSRTIDYAGRAMMKSKYVATRPFNDSGSKDFPAEGSYQTYTHFNFLLVTMEYELTAHPGIEVLEFWFWIGAVGSCARYLGLQSAPRTEALCSKNIDFILDLLENVDDTEPTASVDPMFTPTKLIDLGEGESDMPRLIATEKVEDIDAGDEQFIYAALSYCWGPSSENLKTTNENLHQHSQGIEMESLPGAIRDAVVVCRALSIRYLWVDALCIVQDDEEEWRRESETMGDVYHSAWVTIANLASSSSGVGFLQRSPHQATIPFRSHSSPNLSGFLQLTYEPNHIERQILDGGTHDYSIFDNHYATSAWNQRAWTHQENVLSSRLICFSQATMAVRVKSVFFYEASLPSDCRVDDLDLVMAAVNSYCHASGDKQTFLERIYEDWYEFSCHYNMRKLTVETDKLVARSGFMNYISGIIGDRNIFGLWENDLVRSILWTTTMPQDGWLSFKNNLNDAWLPSWTPLRLNAFYESGTESFPLNYNISRNALVHRCKISALSNQHHRVDSATNQISHLELQGFLLSISKCSIRRDYDRSWIIRIDKHTALNCEFDWRYRPKHDIGFYQLKCISLAMIATSLSAKSSGGAEVIWGLILLPNGISKEYWRVGVFSTYRPRRSKKGKITDCRKAFENGKLTEFYLV